MESIMKNTWNLIEIADDHALKNNTHVGSKEEANIDILGPTWMTLMYESNLGGATLQVDQDKKDETSA